MSAQNISKNKFFVWAIIGEVLEFWRGHGSILWRPILIGTLLGGLSLFLSENKSFPDAGAMSEFSEILNGALWIIKGSLYLLGLDIFISLAISCHRLILMKNTNDSYHQSFFHVLRELNFSFLFFNDFPQKKSIHWLREANFFFLFLSVYMGAKLVFFFGQWVIGPFIDSDVWEGVLLYFIVFPGFFFCLGRYSLVCSALAIEAVDMEQGLEWSWTKKLEWSWKATRGHGWHLAVLVGGVPLMIGVSYEFLAFHRIQEMIFLDSFLQSFLWFFFLPTEMAVLSLAFRKLGNEGSS